MIKEKEYIWSDSEISSTVKLLLPKIEKLFLSKISNKSEILDAGCGTGYLTNWLGKKILFQEITQQEAINIDIKADWERVKKYIKK